MYLYIWQERSDGWMTEKSSNAESETEAEAGMYDASAEEQKKTSAHTYS